MLNLVWQECETRDSSSQLSRSLNEREVTNADTIQLKRGDLVLRESTLCSPSCPPPFLNSPLHTWVMRKLTNTFDPTLHIKRKSFARLCHTVTKPQLRVIGLNYRQTTWGQQQSWSWSDDLNADIVLLNSYGVFLSFCHEKSVKGRVTPST